MARTSTRTQYVELDNQISPEIQAKLAEKVKSDINPNLSLEGYTGNFNVAPHESEEKSGSIAVIRMFTSPSDLPQVTHSIYIPYGNDQTLIIDAHVGDTDFRVIRATIDNIQVSELDERLNTLIANSILNATHDNESKSESDLLDGAKFELAPE